MFICLRFPLILTSAVNFIDEPRTICSIMTSKSIILPANFINNNLTEVLSASDTEYENTGNPIIFNVLLIFGSFYVVLLIMAGLLIDKTGLKMLISKFNMVHLIFNFSSN